MKWGRITALLATFALLFSPGLACAAPPDIAYAQLPPEARETLAMIRRGPPFPHARDGATFHNREGLLPPMLRGTYREYTVPTPGARTRGARRIVVAPVSRAAPALEAAAGAAAEREFVRHGEFYYSDDHYRSFRRIIP